MHGGEPGEGPGPDKGVVDCRGVAAPGVVGVPVLIIGPTTVPSRVLTTVLTARPAMLGAPVVAQLEVARRALDGSSPRGAVEVALLERLARRAEAGAPSRPVSGAVSV